MGSLAVNSVFKGIGVGDEKASSLSATSNWILRQGNSKGRPINLVFLSVTRRSPPSKTPRDVSPNRTFLQYTVLCGENVFGRYFSRGIYQIQYYKINKKI